MSTSKPTTTQLIHALRDVETNVQMADRITSARDYTEYLRKTLALTMPPLAESYGIDPLIDYARGAVHRRAIALDHVVRTQGQDLPPHLPVPAALTTVVHEWGDQARQLRIDVEAHLAARQEPS